VRTDRDLNALAAANEFQPTLTGRVIRLHIRTLDREVLQLQAIRGLQRLRRRPAHDRPHLPVDRGRWDGNLPVLRLRRSIIGRACGRCCRNLARSEASD
jgi:hypothetical protein